MTDAYETTIQLSRIVDNFLDRPNFYSAGPQASRQLNPSPSPGYCFRVVVVWLSGVMVGALDSRLNGSNPRPCRFQPTILDKLFAYMCPPVIKQYNLIPVKVRRCPAAGKVTVGLALHWPCVTDFSGSSAHGLTT